LVDDDGQRTNAYILRRGFRLTFLPGDKNEGTRMARERWLFYTDLFGMQRWEQVDECGTTLQESDHGFDTRAEALEDAFRHGYPGTEQAVTCALQCRVVRVPTSVGEEREA
jgi:hypothetical protein